MASHVLFFAAIKVKGEAARKIFIIGSRQGSLIISDSAVSKAIHLSYIEDGSTPMEITPHVSSTEIFIPVTNSSQKLTIYQYTLDSHQLTPKLVLQTENPVTTARFLHSNPNGGAGAFLGGALVGGLLVTALFAPALFSRNPGHSITNRLIFITDDTFSYGVTVKTEGKGKSEEMEGSTEMEQIISVPISK